MVSIKIHTQKQNKMKTSKFLLSVVSVLFAISASAAKGDEIWKSITNWSDYCHHGEFGDITGMALYDIDSDGISECIVFGESGNAVLTCGDGTGKYGMLNIKIAVNSVSSTSIGIVKNQPFVTHDGGCGTGCHISEYYKIEKSRMVVGYQMVETFNPVTEKLDAEYSVLTPGENIESISANVFKKNRPKVANSIPVTTLSLLPLAQPTCNEAFTISHMKNIVRDGNDYFYEILNAKEVAVAKGGAYTGDVVIPENIVCEGKTYKVTTVRREAFYKNAEAHNIGNITSITLPWSVTLIGTDAFRNNRSLRTINYNPKARIEVRAFWGCPNLKIEKNEPMYAFTDFYDRDEATKERRTEAMGTFFLPYEHTNDTVAAYQWAIHKHNHNGIFFREWTNMKNEEAMACFSVETSKVRGGIFCLQNDGFVETMFKGNMNPCAELILADNSYVATHEFLVFSRWMFGEQETSAPADFKQTMEAKYGKKVKYSYEVGKLANSNEKLIITEFAVKNNKAQFVLSWLKNGKEVCSYTETQDVAPGEPTDQSVWNVDDDGNYGIPELLSVARDEQGNVELFIHHPAPESRTFYHLAQQGNKFVKVSEDCWYVWF